MHPIVLIFETRCVKLHAAVRQIEVGGDATQLEAAANVLVQARRSLYLILAGEAEDVGE